jgi:plastocyanin
MSHLLKALMLITVLLCGALLSSCSPRHVITDVRAGNGTVEIIADNFHFTPNLIEAETGRPFRLLVENVSRTEHNITIADPDGAVLVSRDIPAGATAVLDLTLERPGVYPFHCDKPLHPTLGMRGQIQVTTR